MCDICRSILQTGISLQQDQQNPDPIKFVGKVMEIVHSTPEEGSPQERSDIAGPKLKELMQDYTVSHTEEQLMDLMMTLNGLSRILRLAKDVVITTNPSFASPLDLLRMAIEGGDIQATVGILQDDIVGLHDDSQQN